MDVAAVKLRLLPQPGFDLENFVAREIDSARSVAEAPAVAGGRL